MSRNAVIGIVVVVVVIVLGWYFTQSQRTQAPTVETPTTTQEPAPQIETATPSSEVQEIKVSGSEFVFSPKTLTVKAGEKVRIAFKNNGKLSHNITIDELNVASKTISSGETDTVEFVAQKTGSYVMYCSVGNHRQRGLEGSVEVN